MAPETIIIAAAVVCAGLVLVMVRLTRHFSAPQPISVTSEWLDRLSIDAANLLRLLDEDRFQFSPTQPDFTPKMATKLRILYHEFLCVCWNPSGDCRQLCGQFAEWLVGSDDSGG